MRNGRRNQFYENMRLVSEGDMIFSYYNSLIQYLGTATGKATAATKPANLANRANGIETVGTFPLSGIHSRDL